MTLDVLDVTPDCMDPSDVGTETEDWDVVTEDPEVVNEGPEIMFDRSDHPGIELDGPGPATDLVDSLDFVWLRRTGPIYPAPVELEMMTNQPDRKLGSQLGSVIYLIISESPRRQKSVVVYSSYVSGSSTAPRSTASGRDTKQVGTIMLDSVRNTGEGELPGLCTQPRLRLDSSTSV
jgi:hypothetical protein